MATPHKQPKPLHSTTVTDLIPNETEATGQQSLEVRSVMTSRSSTIVQASIDTNTKTMNLSLANCNLAIFGQSTIVHHRDCHLLGKKQDEGDLRRADCHLEQIQPMEAEADSTVQCLSRPRDSKEDSQLNYFCC